MVAFLYQKLFSKTTAAIPTGELVFHICNEIAITVVFLPITVVAVSIYQLQHNITMVLNPAYPNTLSLNEKFQIVPN